MASSILSSLRLTRRTANRLWTRNFKSNTKECACTATQSKTKPDKVSDPNATGTKASQDKFVWRSYEHHPSDERPAGYEELEGTGSMTVIKNDFMRWYDMYLDGYNDFGKTDMIHTVGIPGLGTGPTGTVHMCHDPYEYMKVIRAEGKHPSGAIEMQWVNRDYFDKRGMKASAEFFGRGEGWRQQRQLISRDLMTPSAYKSYSNAVATAAKFASAGVQNGTQHSFLGRASFDMFGAAFFGEQLMSANEETLTPENKKFCDSAEIILQGIMTTMNSPQEYMAYMEGTVTPIIESHNAAFDYCNEHAAKLTHEFIAQMEAGTLNEDQKNSYLFAALNRQKTTDTDVENLVEVLNIFLLAAVDTTSAYLHWVLMALGAHQDVQQKVYNELTMALGDKEISRELISQKRWLPYLHNVQREAHRQRAAIVGVFKVVDEPLTVCGYDMSKGDSVWLDNYSIQNDTNIMPDAAVFRPERWNDDAVEARKGTHAEVVDHPLLRSPFSAGARMCPGSRVADLEVLVFAAQLVRDYKITLTDPSITQLSDIPYQTKLTIQPLDHIGLNFERRV